MLGRMLEHNSDDIRAGLRKLHSEDLLGLFLPNVMVMKYRRMSWATHVACTRETRIAYSVVV